MGRNYLHAQLQIPWQTLEYSCGWVFAHSSEMYKKINISQVRDMTTNKEFILMAPNM